MRYTVTGKVIYTIVVCIIILLMLSFLPNIVRAVGTFNIGDTVKVTTTDGLNVRTGPGTSYPEITDPDYPNNAPIGTVGVILSGPSNANGYVWWEINYGPGLYSGWSVESGIEKISPPPATKPGAFTLSEAIKSGDQIMNRLSWTASSGVVSYAVYRNGVFYFQLGTLGTFFNNTDVVSGTTYTYFIRATNGAGSTDSNSITLIAISPATKPGAVIVNSLNQFLTLPFRDPDIVVKQGWRYNAPIRKDPNDPFKHEGIDYAKDMNGNWKSFAVVAAADGTVIWSEGGGYGKFVLIRHTEKDQLGRYYYTLYAHLDNVTLGNEFYHSYDGRSKWIDSQWSTFASFPVKREEVIGWAGNTGAPDVGIHLHFEVNSGGYVQNRVDPYDLYTIMDYYLSCGTKPLWTVCPPNLLVITKPIITSPLEITPAKETYRVGDTLTAKFTIKNEVTLPITFDMLTVGGRLNGWCTTEGCPDFTHRSITLKPDASYHYEGYLTLTQSGNYHLFIAYYTENPTPEEKKLLDENSWNTSIDLEKGLTNTDRIENIIVFEEEALLNLVSELKDKIDKGLHQQIKYPPYLLDEDSFKMAVATEWTRFVSWIRQTHLTEKYDELYQTGSDYDYLSVNALIIAHNFLDGNDVVNAKKYLQKAYTYEMLSAMSFGAAAEIFDNNLETAKRWAGRIKNLSESFVTIGLTYNNPVAAKAVGYIYIGVDYAIDRVLIGEEPAAKNAIVKNGSNNNF